MQPSGIDSEPYLQNSVSSCKRHGKTSEKHDGSNSKLRTIDVRARLLDLEIGRKFLHDEI